MTPAAAVLDVTDATFNDAVVERSRVVPIVVDFWAPWCGPCRILGPILEQVIEEQAGKVELVKLNTDENQVVAQAHRIEGIPAVFAYKDGARASQFVGALPEAQVRAFVEELLPSEADDAAEEATALLKAGRPGAAREHFEAIVKADPNHEAATAMLAHLLLQAGEIDRAAELAAKFPRNKGAQKTLALVNLRRAAAGLADAEGLRARVVADEASAEAHYHLAVRLSLDEDWQDAFEHFLSSIRIDRKRDDQAARLRMLDAFRVLGDDHELTRECRRRLGSVLF